MVVQADQDRMRQLLVEALPMLCKSGLTFNSEFCIEALIGITLDKNDVMLVSIKETVKNPGADDERGSERSLDISISHGDQSSLSQSRKKPHRKRRRSRSSQASSDSEADDYNDESVEPSPMKREKKDLPAAAGSLSDFDSASNSLNFQSADLGDHKPSFDDDETEPIIVKQEPGHSTDFSDVSFGNIESGQGYDVSSMNQTFPGASGASSQMGDLNNTSLDPHNSTWLWRSVDGSREYTLLEESTQRNSSYVTDDLGYFYVQKYKVKSSVRWICKRRSKKNTCPAALSQKPEGFTAIKEHNHLPENDKLNAIRVKKAIRAEVGAYHGGNDLKNIVREILTRTLGEGVAIPSSWGSESSLVRLAQKIRKAKLKEFMN